MKQEEIISFLESGALESFLLGMCSEKEAKAIEQLIQKHPEVRKAYDELQAEVEQFSNQFSQSAPQHSKEVYWARLINSSLAHVTKLLLHLWGIVDLEFLTLPQPLLCSSLEATPPI